MPGQLEHEIGENAWLSGPATSEILFKRPVPERWHDAAALMGIEIDLLSDQVGHA